MSLALIHSSVITPLGADIDLVVQSANAGIKPFENALLFGKNGPRIKLAQIPRALAEMNDHIQAYPKGTSSFVQRFINLATLALLELRAVIGKAELTTMVSTDAYNLKPANLYSELLPTLLGNANISFDSRHSFLTGSGRLGLAQCLQKAEQYVEATHAPYVLIGCLDSLIEPTRLLALSRAGRLVNPESNFASRYTHSPAMGGVIPSEAMVWLIFASQYSALPGNNHYLHLTDNITHISSGDSTHQREGMSAAFDGLNKRYGPSQALFSCETGEPKWTRDLQSACLQHKAYIDNQCRLIKLCNWLGDVGAAAPALALAIAQRLMFPQVTIASWDERESANVLQFNRQTARS